MKAINYSFRPPVETTSADLVTYAPRRFSVEEYYRLEEFGILHDDERLELIDGWIVVREPANPPHSGVTIRLTRHLSSLLSDRALVSVQNPLQIDDYNHPQPDVAVLRLRDDYYETSHPSPEDVYLVIEVALTSLRVDQRIKVPLYARAGIRELWIVNVPEGLVEVYREPSATGYRRISKFGPEATLSIEAFPTAEIPAADVIGRRD